MIFGSLAEVGGLVFVPLGRLFAWLSLPFLLYFEKLVSFFADLHWVWRVEEFSWQLILGYYLFLAAIIITIKKIRKE
jgi:hypothetical protein